MLIFRFIMLIWVITWKGLHIQKYSSYCQLLQLLCLEHFVLAPVSWRTRLLSLGCSDWPAVPLCCDWSTASTACSRNQAPGFVQGRARRAARHYANVGHCDVSWMQTTEENETGKASYVSFKYQTRLSLYEKKWVLSVKGYVTVVCSVPSLSLWWRTKMRPKEKTPTMWIVRESRKRKK